MTPIPLKCALLLFSCTLVLTSCAGQVTQTAADLPSSTPVGELQVDSIHIAVLESFPVQIQVNIEGQLPDGCIEIETIEAQRQGSLFQIQINTRRMDDADCPPAQQPFESQVMLDVFQLPAGEYTVEVNDLQESFTLELDNFPPPTHEPDLELQTRGVQLIVPVALGANALVERVPSPSTDSEGPYFGQYPDYRSIVFTAYPLTESFHAPRIEIYPVAETEAMNEWATEEIEALRQLLLERTADIESMPFLPIFNAAQVMHAKVRYLEGEGSLGVRYLTQYGQGIVPINNHELFYTYQGLTADGRYYVIAILPVSHPDLPKDFSDFPGGDAEDFYENFEAYRDADVILLNESPPESFTPSLLVLDDLIASLRVE